MILPNTPVTLAPEQVAELNQQLSRMRHDINNSLANIIACGELIRLRPEAAAKYADTLASAPHRIAEQIREYSAAWEKATGIRRE